MSETKRVSRDRVCALCGGKYRSIGNLKCEACRGTDRVCECGRAFRGRVRKCSRCRTTPKTLARRRERRRELPPRYAFELHGVTPERYGQMLDAQGGGCAVCGTPPKKKRLHVDHDHGCCPGPNSCGRCVRGLLCYRCNSAAGLLRDSAAIVRKLADYLSAEDPL